jgi:hypothetical protein
MEKITIIDTYYFYGENKWSQSQQFVVRLQKIIPRSPEKRGKCGDNAQNIRDSVC